MTIAITTLGLADDGYLNAVEAPTDLVISGTATPSSLVSISFSDGSGVIYMISASANAAGNWSFVVPSVTVGTFGQGAITVNLAENNVQSASDSFTIDTLAPVPSNGAVTIADYTEPTGAVTAGQVLATLPNTDSGTALSYGFGASGDLGGKIELVVNGGVTEVRVVDPSYFDSNQRNGIVVNLVVTDAAGNVANDSLTVTLSNLNDAPQLGFVQDFSAGTAGIITGGGYGGIATVASGTNGIVTPDGGDYAVVTEVGGSGPFTRFDGYRAEFLDGRTAAVSVYLDTGWAAGEGFDYSVALNGSDNAHQRDFVFHVTKDTSTGELLVSSSNGSGFAPREDLETLNHTTVTTSGWYTLQHVFLDQGGVAAVQMNLLDASGAVVWTQTLSSPADTIPAEAGGNRYGWFTDVSVTGGLAIDDLSLNTSATALSGQGVEVADGAPTEGTAPITAQGLIEYHDADLTDSHSVSVTAGGPGYAGSLTATVDAGAPMDGKGQVSWSYTAVDSEIDSLAAGQIVKQSYTITLDDGEGGTSSQTVVITLTGANDGPVIAAGSVTAGVTEDVAVTAGNLTQTGTIAFADVDLIDTHSTSASFTSTTGAAQLGSLTASVSTDTTGGAAGEITWNYSVNTAATQFLATGETVTETYTVTLSDNHGGTTTKDIAITITGTNDAPQLGFVQDFSAGTAGIITGGGYGGIATVASGTNGIVTPDGGDYAVVTEVGGSGPFTRFDGYRAEFLDGRTAAVSVYLDTGWAAGEGFDYSVALNGSDNAHQRDFVFHVTKDTSTGELLVSSSNGSGFAPREDLETLNHTTVTTSGWYTLQHVFLDQGGVAAVQMNLLDASGAVVWTQTLSSPADTIPAEAGGNRYGWFTDVSVTGGLAIDDLSLNTSATALSGQGVEVADGAPTEGTAPITAQGLIEYHDADLTDSHSVSVTAGGPGYAGSLTATVDAGAPMDGKGQVSWSYTAVDSEIDSLAAGQIVKQSYTITLDDGEGGTSSQTVVITLTGANDGPVIAAGSVTAGVTEDVAVTAGNLTQTGTIAFADVDLIDTHSTSASFTSTTGAAQLGSLTASVSTDTTGGAAGEITWNYSVNTAATQFLATGETVTETYTVTLSDNHGGTTTKDIAITITGTNDAPQLGFVQDFSAGTAGIITGGGYGGIATVASGTNGIVTPDGGDYAVVTEVGGSGPFTRFDGYRAEFLDGRTAAVSVYLDTGWAAGEGFDYSVALNGSDNAHQRDFVFHVTKDTSTGELLVSSSNGSGFAPREDLETLNHTTVTTSGWYTLQHVFLDQGGVAAVQMNLLDASGAVVWTQTLSSPADTIPAEAGGNRYGWFTDVSVTGGLAIDDLSLNTSATALSGQGVEVADGAPTEGTAPITAQGLIEYHDADLTDSHSVSVTAGGPGYAGSLTATVDAGAPMDGKGQVSWSYTAVDSEIDSLAAGQIVKQSYTITLDDGEGGTSSQTVVITLTGANDGPVIAAGSVTAGVTEDVAVTAGNLTQTGTIAFADVDLIDTHSTSASFTSTTGAAQLGSLTASVSTDTTGGAAGEITWNYSVNTAATQFLATGETVTETYTVTLSDNHGGTTTKDIAITITGTNDAPVVSGGTFVGAVAEAAEPDAGAAALTATGSISFTDADLNDIGHAATATAVATGVSAGLAGVDLTPFLSLTPTKAAGGTVGAVDWAFSAPDATFDYLAVGEVATLTYTVTIADGDGGSTTQDVVITVTGANDAPTIAALTAATDEDQPGFSLDLLTGASDIDSTDVPSVAALSATITSTGGAAITLVQGVDYFLTGSSLSFDPNLFNGLDSSEAATLVFNYNVIDGNGGVAANTATITVNGRNDAPVANADTYTVTENAIATFSVVFGSTNGSVADSDVDGEGLSVIAAGDVLDAASGQAIGGDVMISSVVPGTFFTDWGAEVTIQSNGLVTYNITSSSAAFNHLALGQTAVDTFSYTISDANGGATGTPSATSTTTVSVTIVGTNDPITAQNDAIVATENAIASLTGDLVANDTDVDVNDSKTVTNVTSSGGSTVTVVTGGFDVAIGSGVVVHVLADGTYTVEVPENLAAAQVVSGAFTYTVQDGGGIQSNANVSVTVNGVNDAPVSGGDFLATLDEGGSVTLTMADLHFTDVDDTGSGIVYTVTSLGNTTGILLNGAALALGQTFTQADVNSGRVSLLQDGANATSDGIALSIDDGNEDGSAAATATLSVAINPINDLPMGSVEITGTATEDATLTASNTLTDGDGLGVISYQWQRDGVDIGGATLATYTLGQADVGKAITVVASYTDGQGTAESVVSGATALVANVNDLPTGSVTITGTAAEDATLTATNSLADEDGLGPISYQWQRDGVDISGATANSFTLGQDDVGKAITVVASYTDGQGTAESVVSGATALVTNADDLPTGGVTITGTAAEDATLTATNSLADEDGLGPISYQWQRDGVDISGATANSFTLGQVDVGKAITVVASYTDGQGHAEAVTSGATALVANVNDLPTGSVAISGTAKEDATLTAANTLADEDGLGPISYQWQRDGVNIGGATSGNYTLGQADVGKAITVVAKYTDAQGTAESVASGATALVANVNDLPTGSVVISGNATEDRTLTATNTLADEDGLGQISYRWQRDGANISGATAATYKLTQADVGKAITVVARYTDGQGKVESVSSAPTSDVVSVNTAPVVKDVTVAALDNTTSVLVSADYSDVDPLDTFTFAVGTAGTQGQVVNNNDGTFTYLLDGKFGYLGVDVVLTDSFTYTVNDGWGGVSTATVNVNITGLDNRDILTGTSEDDSLFGGISTDKLYGLGGDDLLNGGDNSDQLYGGSGADTLVGGKGTDLLVGGSGSDWVDYQTSTAITVDLRKTGAQDTGRGMDTLASIENIIGGSGNDKFSGNERANTLMGKSGDDALNGHRGADALLGGRGDDVLAGGAGKDNLTGGKGADTFVFSSALNASNADVITDFNVSQDMIRLQNAVFTGLSNGDLDASAFVANSNGVAEDASDRVVYNSTNGKLYFDADGSGSGARVEFARLTAGLSLTEDNFFVY